jgi:hypothetical protein
LQEAVIKQYFLFILPSKFIQKIMSSIPHGGNMWKNIIIGILTTVVAYLIVHFILDKKDSKKEQKEKAEANRSAWESVNSYTLSATKKFESLACFSCDYSKMKNEIVRELEQDCNSLLNIKGGQYVDEKMKTIIDRTISRFTSLKPLFQAFFDSVFILQSLPDTQKAIRSNKVYTYFRDSKTRIDTVDQKEIDELLGDINKKYKLSLAEPEIKPELNFSKLPGKWKIECLVEVEFNDDGTLTWTEGENVITGTWDRISDRLTIKLHSDQKFVYTILELNDNFMRIQEVNSIVPYGACRI